MKHFLFHRIIRFVSQRYYSAIEKKILMDIADKEVRERKREEQQKAHNQELQNLTDQSNEIMKKIKKLDDLNAELEEKQKQCDLRKQILLKEEQENFDRKEMMNGWMPYSPNVELNNAQIRAIANMSETTIETLEILCTKVQRDLSALSIKRGDKYFNWNDQEHFMYIQQANGAGIFIEKLKHERRKASGIEARKTEKRKEVKSEVQEESKVHYSDIVGIPKKEE